MKRLILGLILCVSLVSIARSCRLVVLVRTDLPLPFETNDIVAVFNDGYKFEGELLNKDKFAIVDVPDLDVKTAQDKYIKSLTDGTTSQTIVKMYEYKLDTSKLTLTEAKATTDKVNIDKQVIDKAVAEKQVIEDIVK